MMRFQTVILFMFVYFVQFIKQSKIGNEKSNCPRASLSVVMYQDCLL